MNDRVSITVENHVADVRLTRADKMNALDPAMFQGIISAGEELAAMKGVRAVVLSGEGRSFCADRSLCDREGFRLVCFHTRAKEHLPPSGDTK